MAGSSNVNKKLIDKWKLNTQAFDEDASIYNDNYSLVFTGNYYHNEDEPIIPGYYLILSFSKNLDMNTAIKFFSEFQSSLDHFDAIVVSKGLWGHYTGHTKEMVRNMIEKL
jgi:hypothetical protein